MPMQPKKVTNFSLQNNSLDGTLNSNSFEDTLTSHYQVIVKFSSTQAGINGILGPDQDQEIFRNLGPIRTNWSSDLVVRRPLNQGFTIWSSAQASWNEWNRYWKKSKWNLQRSTKRILEDWCSWCRSYWKAWIHGHRSLNANTASRWPNILVCLCGSITRVTRGEVWLVPIRSAWRSFTRTPILTDHEEL